MEPISTEASVQYDDMVGTTALDGADFDGLKEALDLPERMTVVGIELYATHPPLNPNNDRFARSAYTHLRLYVFDLDLIPDDGGGLPGLVSKGKIPVHRYQYDTATATLGSLTDALALLVQGAKRLQITLWSRSVAKHLDNLDLVSETDFEFKGTQGWLKTP